MIAIILCFSVLGCVQDKHNQTGEFKKTNPESENQYRSARMRMIKEQLVSPGRGITNKSVLKAMEEVPRHKFVPAQYRDSAYADSPLPIGEGQTISQPYIVAYMTELLDPQPTDRVLEIGTGSGYQAAVLSCIVSNVYTIEILESLGEHAKTTLDELGYDNVHVKIGDGYKGWPEHAPFDGIIVTCAPENVPRPLVEQLKEGGRIVVPVGKLFYQELYLLQKEDGEITRRAVLPVRFVPMTGEAAED